MADTTVKENRGAEKRSTRRKHILVCLSSAPSNERVIHIAAEMAESEHAELTALYVETPNASAMKEIYRKQLQHNMRAAEELGAAAESVYGEDVAYQISEYARLHNVTTIVIGRSIADHAYHFPPRTTLVEKLLSNEPEMDIHIIPDKGSRKIPYREAKKKGHLVFSLKDLLFCVLALVLATLIGLLFQRFGFTDANIIMIYLLSVMVISAVVTNHIYILGSSIANVIVFNFFFTVPKYTLLAYDQSYPVTFLILFLAGLFTGTLAARLKDTAQQAARTSYRTQILFDTNRMLSNAHGSDAIIRTTARQLQKLLEKDIVVYFSGQKDILSDPQLYPFQGSGEREDYNSEYEHTVAAWTMRNNKRAGATTDVFEDAGFLYYALRVDENVYGVIGIALSEPLEAFENSILLSILGECALALENDRNAREKEEAHVQMVNEQLRANLLRSISHDLRTPLTSISGNASNLLTAGKSFDDETRQQLYTDIYDDSMWLINLVENLLAISRINEGKLEIHMQSEIAEEVVTEALKHIDRRGKEHTIKVVSNEELLFAKMDARLIVQVIINLVNNAIKYTERGSLIRILIGRRDKMVEISVTDNGPGISDEDKKHIFEMFYTGKHRVADSQRSLGLGLSLCKSIVEAHGGKIEVTDNEPKGCRISFTLQMGEVNINE